MTYNPHPPYEILRNQQIDFPTMQRLRRFARYWDLVANSGNFVETRPLLWAGSGSPFAGFMHWSDWLFAREGRTYAISLARLAECLFQYLTEQARLEPKGTAQVLWRDYQRGGRSDRPEFLRRWLPAEVTEGARLRSRGLHRRQARHRSDAGEV